MRQNLSKEDGHGLRKLTQGDARTINGVQLASENGASGGAEVRLTASCIGEGTVNGGSRVRRVQRAKKKAKMKENSG